MAQVYWRSSLWNADFCLRDDEEAMRGPQSQSLNRQSAFPDPQFRHGGNVHAFTRAQGVAPEDVLDFSASINPLGWPPAVRETYCRALSRIVHYPEPYAETLAVALAEYHSLDPAGVLVGNGSTQLIHLLARTLAAPRVLLVAPLFSEHEAAFRLGGAQVAYFDLRPPQFALSLEHLGAALTEGYNSVVLTNPNSPTGTLVPRAQGEEVVRMCRHARVTLVIDETFVDWVEEESLKQLAARSPHLIVLRSLTKFFAVPGLRIGYLIAQPRLVGRLRARLEPWSVNTVAQEVALACLRDQRFGQRSRKFMAQERAWLCAQLAALKGLRPFPSQANFLLVQVTAEALRAAELVEILARENLLIRACEDFRGLGRRFFRVAVRTRRENQRLLTALRAALR
jgi:threonine-phosphate decarboxylase